MTSLDAFITGTTTTTPASSSSSSSSSSISRKNIRKIDLIKIDAEGYDAAVVVGSKKLLTDYQVKVITFEYQKQSSMASAFKAFAMLEELGYICYSGAFKLMYKLSSSCIKDTWLKSHAKLDWGNIFCAHKVRARKVITLFDGMTFIPMYITKGGNSTDGNTKEKQKKKYEEFHQTMN